MAYGSKNPKFTTAMLVDQVATAGVNPPSSSHRIINRNGALYMRTSAGIEYPVGNGIYAAKSADYTVLDTDGIGVIAMTTGASNRTVTLPAAANNTHRMLRIKKVDSGVGKVIIDGNASETVDGVTTKDVVLQYDFLEVVCDGSNWSVVSRNPTSPWTTYTITPTDSAGSPASVYTGTTTKKTYWRRNGQNMEIFCLVLQSTSGTAGSGVYRFPLPSGFTVDTTYVTANAGDPHLASSLGSAAYNSAGGPAGGTGYVAAYNTTNLMLAIGNSTTNEDAISSSYGAANAGLQFKFAANFPCTEFANT